MTQIFVQEKKDASKHITFCLYPVAVAQVAVGCVLTNLALAAATVELTMFD